MWNSTTGRYLGHGGFLSKTAPAVVAPEQMSATQLQASTSLPLIHPFSKSPSNSLVKSCKGRHHHPQSQLQGKNSLFFVLQATVKRQRTANNSQFRQRSGGHYGKIRLSNTAFKLFSGLSSRASRPKSLLHGWQKIGCD